MPFVRFTGFEKNVVETVAPAIIEEMAAIANIPQEIVKIELLHVEKITNSPQSVEIYMFPREQEKHDAIAKMIDGHLKKQGYDRTHIFYVLLQHSLYYKEGLPLGEIPRKTVPEA
ncbi:DUF1904 family protein [Paenibacillus chibensis]|uniref:DUF1904 family protein n=1 Tax=Paenibacillus chibensis TaxID=59846 RepID=A0ABU6PMJ1_9BACL|nr:DUF1904 family protein [Paenibacillus chibensis]MEC0372408.1 DUF1904 family protein [Paenibacillus chibensis]MED5016071.1 DUF1904 family protein [Paenibacillus chibensis]